MNDSRDFKKEYDAFFNGLEMQEMWMPYAERLGEKYRFLIYEYPFHRPTPTNRSILPQSC